MVAGGGRLWPVRRRRCRAWQRLGLGVGARGSLGELIPPLTLGDGGPWAALHGGGRSSTTMVVVAALEARRGGARGRRGSGWWLWSSGVLLVPSYRWPRRWRWEWAVVAAGGHRGAP